MVVEQEEGRWGGEKQQLSLRWTLGATARRRRRRRRAPNLKAPGSCARLHPLRRAREGEEEASIRRGGGVQRRASERERERASERERERE